MSSKRERVKSLVIAGILFTCLLAVGAIKYFSIAYVVSAICGFFIGTLLIAVHYARPENLSKTTSPALRVVLGLLFTLMVAWVGPALQKIIETSLIMSQILLGFSTGAFLILVFGSAFVIQKAVQ